MATDLWDGLEFVDDSVESSSLTPVSLEDGPERLLARIEEQEGRRLEGAAREAALNQIRNGDFNIKFPKDVASNLWDGLEFTTSDAPAELPVLPAKAEEEPKGFFGQRMDEMGQQFKEIGQMGETLYGGGQRALANIVEQTPRLSKFILEGMAAAGSQGVTRGGGDIFNTSQQADEIFDPGIDAVPEATRGLRQAAKGHMQAGEELRRSIEGRDWLTRELGGGLIDAAQSPSSAVSILGGPFGAIAVADAYGQAYSDARAAGLDKDDAEIMAWSQAAPESISFIPAGKVLSKVPGLGPLLKSRAAAVERGLVKKLTNPGIAAGLAVAKTAVGETLEETGTGTLQDIASAALAGQEHSKALAKYAESQTPKTLDEFLSERYRDARAGFVMGGLGGTIEGAGARKEFNKEVEDRANKLTDTNDQTSEDSMKPTRLREGELKKRETNVDLDIQRELDRIAQERAKEDAFKQAEQDKAEKERAAQQQKEIEQEAGFRTIEAEASVKGKTRLDKYGPGNAEVVPINPPAEVTPEAVQAEREQAQAAEAARLERVEVGKWEQRVRSRQAQIARNAKSAEAKAEKKARTAEGQRQREITDRLLAENPGKTPEELGPLLRAAVEAPVEAKAPKATTGKSRFAKQPKAAPVKPDKEVAKSDTEIDALSDKLGLEMADGETAPEQTPNHKEKVRGIFRALVKANTQDSVDVQNLVLQGKTVFVPNGKSVGLNVSENAKAAWDDKSGKMYFFTDKMNGDEAVGSIIRALHESTHGGQDNSREGRTSIMQMVMGKGHNDAKQKVLNAYGKNTIATKAIDLAEAAGKRAAARMPEGTSDAARQATYERVKDLEIMAHLASEAKKANTYGGMGGVIRQMRAGARQLIREKMGVDLDVTLDDIVHASQQTAGELVKTDVKRRNSKTAPLEMVGGETATGYREAVEDRATYKGRVDQKERFEFSDQGAAVDQRALAKLATVPNLPLGDVLTHPELYKQYPKLATKIKIQIDPTLKGRKEGYVNGNTIAISQNYLDSNKRSNDELLDTLLHEVQHQIQSIEGFVPGSSTRYFLPKQVMNVRNMAERGYQRSLRRFDLEKAIANMPATVRLQWLAREAWHTRGSSNVEGELLTPEEASKERFIQNGYIEFVKNDDVQDQAEAVQKALSEYQNAKQEFEKANDVAYATYQADYGEAEARTTSIRKNMSLDARRKIPLEPMMKLTGVPVENTIDSTKYMRDSGELRANQRADSFRAKGEGEIDERTYDDWAEDITGMSGGDADQFRQALAQGKETFAGGNRQDMEILVGIYDWSRKAAKRYLDKYAGTPEDPLKDIELPDGDTWEEAMDGSVIRRLRNGRDTFSPTNQRTEPWYSEYRPDDEFPAGQETRYYFANVIRNYLRHVGDYMIDGMTNGTITNLQQYDLARAVKETKKADEKALKKAAEARAKIDAGLITHRKYKDGSRWVRLTKPGQFAAESDVMGHSVRGYEPVKKVRRGGEKGVTRYWEELDDWLEDHGYGRATLNMEGSAEEIVDELTKQIPEGSKFFADWLRRKNDDYIDNPDWIPESVGGHRNYGEGRSKGFNAIKSGAAEVYSLRDKSGMSHATIEIDRTPIRDGSERMEGNRQRYNEIMQIKGKGNQAPIDKYIPYIQDFILDYQPEDIRESRRHYNYGIGQQIKNTDAGWQMTSDEFTDRLPEATEANSTVLEMADETDGETKLPFTRRIPAWVSHIWSSSSGTGGKIREVIEHAASSPAEQRMIAEGTIGRYRRGVQKLAAVRGMSPKALNNEIMEKLDAIDRKSNDYETNRNNFTKVAEQYGEAGEALIKLRDQADALSLEMLRDRARLVDDGVPMTADEKDTYQTIKNNRGRYAHRQFGIHMGREGKNYAKNLWDNYEKFVAAKGGEVSDQVRDDYERAARAINKITEQLVIPDDEALAEMNAEDTRKLYSEWSENTNDEGIAIEDMKEELAQKRDAIDNGKDLMHKTAESIAKQILGLTEPTSLMAKYYRGGKLDKSILKERTNIAPEIRELMGEIKDPAARLFATVAKQTEFIARNKMLMELRELDEPAHLQPPGMAGRPEVKGMTKLADPAYGPLQNHYVSDNLLGILSDQIEQLATFEQAVAMAAGRNGTAFNRLLANKSIQTWGKLVGYSKMAQIVYNPANFLFNLSGGWTTMLVNGNVNPTTAWKALKTAKDIVAYAKNPDNNTKEARRVTKAGVTDSAFVGEINAETYEELNKILREMQGKTPSTLGDFMKKTNLVAKETYAMMDVVYKIANFYHQADIVLPAYYEAAGIKKTQEEIDREAADIVNDTNITYKRAAPIVKNVERLGLTQFMTYFYETFRTQVNNAKQGVKELQRAKEAPTPEAARIMAAQGTKRLMGQLTYWAAVGTLARAAAHAVFGDDEEKERKLRALLPDYMQNQDFVHLGNDKDGDPVLFNFSRIDPYGPMSDVVRTALNTEASPEKLMHDIYQLYVAPRLGARLYDAVADEVGNKTPASPMVQQIFPKGYSNMLNSLNEAGVSDRTSKSATNVGEAFLPGIAGSFSKNNIHPIANDPASSMAALLSYMGGRMYKINSEKQLTSKAYDYKDVLSDQRKQIADIFTDHPNMDAETLTNRLAKLRNNEEESFDKLKQVYDGMVAAGKSPREINATLKDLRVTAGVMGDLRSGKFKFRSLSPDSLQTYEKKALAKAKTLQEKKEVRQKWKEARALLRVSSEALKNEEQE